MEAANTVEAGDGNLGELATDSRLPCEDLGRRLYRHGIDDQPPAGSQPIEAGVDNTGIARAAANEDRVGIWEIMETIRRLAFGLPEGRGRRSSGRCA
jgi:hypothetical protein